MNLSFRTRLLATLILVVTGAVLTVALAVEIYTKEAFDHFNEQRTAALTSQFRKEFDRSGEDIARKLDITANSEPMLRMALQLSQPLADSSPYITVARDTASLQQLDFLEILSADGTIISSAQWPARFGYKEDWVRDIGSADSSNAFLLQEQLPQESTLAIEALRTISSGGSKFFLVGGKRIDAKFLESLSAPEGLRALVITWPASGASESSASINILGQVRELDQAKKLVPLATRVKELAKDGKDVGGISERVDWSSDPAESEDLRATPLTGRENQLLGALVIASARADLVRLDEGIRKISILIVGAAILAAILVSLWLASRVTRPVLRLAAAADQVAKGNWNSQVEIGSRDEIGQLARAFNHMTGELVSSRERLIQSERVAAWRELARRLAHELRNPLFPLQLTVETLVRAKASAPEQFDEIFEESSATLLAEMTNLQAIIGRFNDFSKMPTPELQNLNVNKLVREVIPLFRVQLSNKESGKLEIETQLEPELPDIHADPVLLRRVLENLMCNALDAMPNGGTLTVKTGRNEGRVLLDISDTGTGLTSEECERLFTPYYTTKQKGTGLGLAIVQSVISDHHGSISVTSTKDRGTTFHIELLIPKAEVTGVH